MLEHRTESRKYKVVVAEGNVVEHKTWAGLTQRAQTEKAVRDRGRHMEDTLKDR
jgi:hypothetical protein